MKEEWRDIESGYQISTLGNVKGLQYSKTKSYLKPYSRGNGYLAVRIRGKNHYVHRLILLAFDADGQLEHVDHIDGNKHNNTLSNLRWATHAENACYAVQKNIDDGGDHSSGCVGLGWLIRAEKWHGRFLIGGVCFYSGAWNAFYKNKWVGRCESKEDSLLLLDLSRGNFYPTLF